VILSSLPFLYIFSGLNGATLEPLVPLLTFIGSLEFDKTLEDRVTISPFYIPYPPLNFKHLIVPEEDVDMENISHWERPLPL
jgi:hypothetical protein